MTFRWSLSRIDTVLLAVLAALLLVVFFVSRENADARLVKSTLESRARTAEINVAETEKTTNLVDLNQALQRARASLANPFPSEEKAAAFGVDIEQSTSRNKVSIISWSNSYSDAVFRNKRFAVVRHTLVAEGSNESLLKFLEEVSATALPVSVEGATLRLQSPGGSVWHLNVELLVYYVQ